MFILDKDIKAGKAVVTSKNPSGGAAQSLFLGDKNLGAQAACPDTDDYDDYAKVIRGGSTAPGESMPLIGALDTIEIQDGEDGYWLHWNRMSDGTLITRKPIAFANSQDIAAYVNPFNVSNINAYKTLWASLPNSSYELEGAYHYSPFVIKVTANLFGGQYSGGILRASNSNGGYEYVRYVMPFIDDFVFPFRSTQQTSYYLFSDFYRFQNYATLPDKRNPTKFGTAENPGGTGYIIKGNYLLNCNFVHLAMLPTGLTPSFMKDANDMGVVTEPTQWTFGVKTAASFYATLDGNADNSIVSATAGGVLIDLSSVWDTVSFGKHEIIVRAKANGYETGNRVTFTKSSSGVSFTSKPAPSTEMPVTCRLVDNCTVPTGATITREVTNNGNDENPSWESYSGTRHEFANAAKTSGQWGLAARITIDNSHGNAEAKISQGIAMGVTYKGE